MSVRSYQPVWLLGFVATAVGISLIVSVTTYRTTRERRVYTALATYPARVAVNVDASTWNRDSFSVPKVVIPTAITFGDLVKKVQEAGRLSSDDLQQSMSLST